MSFGDIIYKTGFYLGKIKKSQPNKTSHPFPPAKKPKTQTPQNLQKTKAHEDYLLLQWEENAISEHNALYSNEAHWSLHKLILRVSADWASTSICTYRHTAIGWATQ